MTVTNETRPSVVSPSNESKNLATLQNEIRPNPTGGNAWLYDEVGIKYDGPNDPITGMPIFYNGIGTVPTITNEAKNNI